MKCRSCGMEIQARRMAAHEGSLKCQAEVSAVVLRARGLVPLDEPHRTLRLWRALTDLLDRCGIPHATAHTRIPAGRVNPARIAQDWVSAHVAPLLRLRNWHQHDADLAFLEQCLHAGAALRFTAAVTLRVALCANSDNEWIGGLIVERIVGGETETHLDVTRGSRADVLAAVPAELFQQAVKALMSEAPEAEAETVAEMVFMGRSNRGEL